MYSDCFFALSSTRSIIIPAARYAIEAKSASELLSRIESSKPTNPARISIMEEKLIAMMLLISIKFKSKYCITHFILEMCTEARTDLKEC